MPIDNCETGKRTPKTVTQYDAATGLIIPPTMPNSEKGVPLEKDTRLAKLIKMVKQINENTI